MNKKYQIIYADPPWRYGSKSKVNDYQGNAEHKKHNKLECAYNTMSVNEIKGLPINNIIDENCACFLWVTDSHLKEGIEIIESWGFKYKTVAFVWVKKTNRGNTYFNIAPWTIKSCEICLLGTKGRMIQHKQSTNIKQLIEATRGKHSQKPIEARGRIEKLFGDLPRIELFARQKTEGWDVWGNEVESDIELL